MTKVCDVRNSTTQIACGGPALTAGVVVYRERDTRKKPWVVVNRKAALSASLQRSAEEKRRRLLREAGIAELPDGHKQCQKCRQVKPLSDFYPRKTDRRRPYVRKPEYSEYRPRCKSCESEDNRRQKQTILGQEYHKNYRLVRRFGITLEQYEQMRAVQGGGCAICGKTRFDDVREHDLAVDHDHSTGVVRGLLCRDCNVALGKFGDSLDVLKKAVAYLEQSK